jgi:autoinducer 2-degrading protein
MFVQFVHMKVKPGRVKDFLEAFRINYEGTIREPGNVRFDVLQHPDDSHAFLIYEVFASENAVAEHRKTPHYKESVLRLDDVLAGPRTKDYFQMVMPAAKDGRV